MLIGTLFVVQTWSSILCDTPFKCKQKVAMNTMTCCKICPSALHLSGEKNYYGFYEFLEKDPNGLSAMTFPRRDEELKFTEDQERKFELMKSADKNINPSLKEELAACPMPQKDNFKLPCCVPCVAEFPDGKDVKGVMYEIKNKKEPINGFGGRPQGPVLILPELQEPRDIPCCGSQASCCRWCPKRICARLELSEGYVEELYWSLCSRLDETERDAHNRQLAQDDEMNKLLAEGRFWDPYS